MWKNQKSTHELIYQSPHNGLEKFSLKMILEGNFFLCKGGLGAIAKPIIFDKPSLEIYYITLIFNQIASNHEKVCLSSFNAYWHIP